MLTGVLAVAASAGSVPPARRGREREEEIALSVSVPSFPNYNGARLRGGLV